MSQSRGSKARGEILRNLHDLHDNLHPILPMLFSVTGLIGSIAIFNTRTATVRTNLVPTFL